MSAEARAGPQPPTHSTPAAWSQSRRPDAVASASTAPGLRSADRDSALARGPATPTCPRTVRLAPSRGPVPCPCRPALWECPLA